MGHAQVLDELLLPLEVMCCIDASFIGRCATEI